MPRKEINYKNTIIYKIVCNDLSITDLYIGHTTDFTRRKNQHKNISNNENDKKYNLKVYQIIRDNGGWSNWNMIEIEKYECNDANEARTRERYHYELLKPNMNKQIPNRPNDGYKIHYERYKECFKKYYDTNKEKIALKKKIYRDENKEAINFKRRELRKEKKALKNNEI